MLGLSFLSLVLAVPALAAPSFKFTGCSVPASVLQVPAGQTQLVAPTTAPNFVALGVGVQNYTCSAAGTYVTAGAVAELFDISCLFNTPEFDKIQVDAFNLWSKFPSNKPSTEELIALLRALGNFDVLGQHYFIANSAGALSPKFDFTSSGKTAGNPNAFVVAAKAGDIPAPTGSADVDWLMLNATSGELAKQVFRVNTKGGQPPASVCCTSGSAEISVKYTAKYCKCRSTHILLPSLTT
ncbi:hypothetical protein BC834DRAFT_828732 [Gloeopeniophorella convolvens]|nr:hypothetical protein BC834DRAFT_828732 [Gloeopeniophorella convolvens]